MARPSGPQIEEALCVVSAMFDIRRESMRTQLARERAAAEQARVMEVLREAVRPRLVWPSKEAAAALGVNPANLNAQSVAGLPEPAQRLPRPTTLHPDREMRLWFVDEILECAARKRARNDKASEGVTGA